MRIATAPESPGDRLVSGEAVELDVRVARIGSRAVALIIDAFGQAVLFMLLFVAASFLRLVTDAAGLFDDGLGQAIFTVILVVTALGYPAFFETLLRGRTPGKAAMGLRVVRDDGGPVRFRHAFTRALLGLALEWPGLLLPVVTWVASLGTMLIGRSGKRLGDWAAGTIVIHERTPASWGWVPAMPPPLRSWASRLDLTGLDDSLALAVRHFLARNREITEPSRTALGRALAREVALCTTPPPPREAPGWAYLAAVIAERNRRATAQLVKARAASSSVWPDLHAAAGPHLVGPFEPAPLPPPPTALRPAVPR
ncbi:RDD family protein [Dactylosporangium sp. NPDC050588]|uniref:RDD family protein n=1 Tax=Dactylosporangium sp. NPDC050588 TaxID=3157211 RepID=UPI0033D9E57E